MGNVTIKVPFTLLSQVFTFGVKTNNYLSLYSFFFINGLLSSCSVEGCCVVNCLRRGEGAKL